jgi:PAS domain-containing protein
LRANRNREAAKASGETGLAALAKLATASFEDLERDLQARIATLEALTLRYEAVIDNISQGVCFFDREERLILCNRRYGEIYRLARSRFVRAQRCARSVEHRAAAGTCAMPVGEYLTLATSINSSAVAEPGSSSSRTGGQFRSVISRCPAMDGGDA